MRFRRSQGELLKALVSVVPLSTKTASPGRYNRVLVRDLDELEQIALEGGGPWWFDLDGNILSRAVSELPEESALLVVVPDLSQMASQNLGCPKYDA